MPHDYATHACPSFLDDFSDFVDGSLPPGRRAELQAHLDCCEGCLQHLSAYRRGIAAYRDVPDIHTDPGEFWLGMRIRLASDVAKPERRTAWRTPAIAGGVMALVALATLWLGLRIDAGFERVAESATVASSAAPVSTGTVVMPAPAPAVAPAPAEDRPIQLASASGARSRYSSGASATRPTRAASAPASADPEFEALRQEIELAGWFGDPYLASSPSFESGRARIQPVSLAY